MAGLLDFLSTDDAQLGLGLLAAGGPTTTPMSFGQRIAAGVGQAQAAKDGRLRNKLLESQIAENTSQDAARRAQLERQQRQDSYYLGGGAAGGAPAAGGPSAVGTPTAAGAALKAAAGAPPDAPPPAQGKFAEWSKQFNIPVDALVADYFSNGGKGIADMLFKAGRPDMQVTNGYSYDKNKVQPGYLPQLNISSNGQATQVQIGPDGQPVVSAPRGAVGTFGAYQGASNRSAADYQPERVLSPDGQMIVRPRSEVLQPSAPPVLPGRPLGAVPGMTGATGPTNAAERGMAAEIAQVQVDPAREAAQVREMLATPGAIRDPGDRAQATSYLQRLESQIAASGKPLIGPGAGVPPTTPMVTAGNVVELSPAQQAQNKANEARLVDTAKADVTRDTGRADANKRGAQIKEISALASSLLDKNPTASGVGALVDSAANFVGQPTRGSTVAQQLEALSGWMVSNVPRMEGPQSNVDVLNYTTMAGRVGDRTLPVEARKAALKTVIELQEKYAALNGAGSAAPSPTPTPGGLPPGWTVKVK